ncbi:DUF3501 family protein [Solemya velum gill symbiont]|uniref:DUF3501 domain-containing protein n=1 Tax=Solemya velum gill symbiont TaxID=2340 RepID=A0A0B0H3E7_SOVGS|nr:DUF3501 family protein [Solemya velum gill symbiont]KHF24738.1 hypothetical protein JV46_02690 [Solemya velum gill symbiont]OOY34762.1 hypothetical protein BOV88_08335 [Solemya velum gill symbiont]OOY37654.1 hypothetical protein BOV89_06300 [Solemya velum gill symbiont]OOY39334.1 hypothetical protein BOV90_09890 [Solemya velum gill symbiont]OOY42281.1 hypothetical protein BOV91_07475 [Solemya velum gill symbiont]
MQKLSRETLYSLEEYAEARPTFRAEVLQHKKNRALAIGEHATLYFEDYLTMKYQVQEMLRIEKIFEKAGIEEELDAYNPLVPDGCNWKATFMIEYGDVEERRKALEKLVGIEDKTWMQVEGFDKVYAIADEDLERTEADKTSAVHFMRFELTPEMAAAAKQGAAINGGIDHDHYNISVSPIPANIRDSLSEDLD